MQWQSSFTHKQLDVIFDVLKSSCKALVPAVSSESNAYQTWVFESDWDEHAPRQTRLRIWQTYQSCWFSQPRFVHFVGVGRHWLSLSFWSHLASTCINHSESTNQSQWWNPNPSSSTMLESWGQSEMLSCCMSHMHFTCHICQSHTSFASPRFTRAASAGWGASMTWQKSHLLVQVVHSSNLHHIYIVTCICCNWALSHHVCCCSPAACWIGDGCVREDEDRLDRAAMAWFNTSSMPQDATTTSQCHAAMQTAWKFNTRNGDVSCCSPCLVRKVWRHIHLSTHHHQSLPSAFLCALRVLCLVKEALETPEWKSARVAERRLVL